MVWLIFRRKILISILLLIHLIVPAQRAQRVTPVRRVTRGPQALPGRKATPALRVQRALPDLKVPQVTQVPQALPALKVPLVPKAPRVAKV